MRKITSNMYKAYHNSKPLSKGNTVVSINKNASCGTLTQIFLHGNLIAEYSDMGLSITNAGWKTNVTKERLNALPGVSVYQKKGQWYLNGKEWNGEWVNINNWND
jgi:hypothetical protein